jgi:hypothetical protein
LQYQRGFTFENPCVAGSIPARATKKNENPAEMWGFSFGGGGKFSWP